MNGALPALLGMNRNIATTERSLIRMTCRFVCFCIHPQGRIDAVFEVVTLRLKLIRYLGVNLHRHRNSMLWHSHPCTFEKCSCNGWDVGCINVIIGHGIDPCPVSP